MNRLTNDLTSDAQLNYDEMHSNVPLYPDDGIYVQEEIMRRLRDDS